MNRPTLAELVAGLETGLAEELSRCTSAEERAATLDQCDSFAAELVKVTAKFRGQELRRRLTE